jgi:hypothetical protein
MVDLTIEDEEESTEGEMEHSPYPPYKKRNLKQQKRHHSHSFPPAKSIQWKNTEVKKYYPQRQVVTSLAPQQNFTP